MDKKAGKLGSRIWVSLIVFGLTGQLAWTIENMYFNVFLYKTITGDPNVIATMVAASAVTATLTTLLMGALSDRVGRRKVFICAGYILWGVSTLAFGFITTDNVAAVFPAANAAMLAGVFVIILDCVMTFFGSTANDAALNAWVTDVTSESNRGRVESVLSVLPLVSMLVIFGVFDGMTQAGEWQKFFLIFGIAITVVGIIGIFLLKDSKSVSARKGGYWATIIYGMRPSVVRAHPDLYLTLLSLGVFGIATQIFFPYLIIYMQNYLKLDSYAIVLGAVLIVASVVSVLCGRLIDRFGRLKFLLPALAVFFAGLILMFFARGMVFVIIAGAVMMSGYMTALAAISAALRDYTPADRVGHFQGIRLIFYVLLPMVTGPYIGAAVISGSGETYVDLGVTKPVPTPYVFLAAAAVLLLVLVPVLILRTRHKKLAAEVK